MPQSHDLPATLWPAVKHYFRPYWKRLALIQLCAFAWPIDGLLLPIIIGHMTDVITSDGTRDELFTRAWPWMLAYLMVWPVTEIGYRMAGFLSAKTIPAIRGDVQTDIYRRIQTQDYNFLVNHQAGDLLSKLRDVSDGFVKLFNEFIWQINNAVFLLIVSFIVLLTIQPILAGLVLVNSFLFFAIAAYANKNLSARGKAMAKSRSALSGHIIDGFVNFMAVRIFAATGHERHHFNALQDDEKTQIRSSVIYTEKVRLAYGVLAIVFSGFVINGGAFYGWYKGWVSPGQIIIINGMMMTILQRIWFLCNDMPDIVSTIGSTNNALQLLSTKPTITDKENALVLAASRGEIELRNINFGYRDGVNFFNDFSLTIPAGQKIGLVGFSGSGKTSFVRLILRLYDIQSGAILIDGQNIADVTQESLRSAISFIPQEADLFHRTIRQNIAIGHADATDEEIIAAAKRAHAHDFIMALPNGYDSIVGERGIKLSGGQRQRIAIARVALRQTPILILDEATSALDSLTEMDVQQSLEELMKNRTTLVIAHRLSTLRHMDRIIVFDQGRIVEDGTLDGLLAKDGVFKTLWDAQVGGFLQDRHNHSI